jgi:hypothetical protein
MLLMIRHCLLMDTLWCSQHCYCLSFVVNVRNDLTLFLNFNRFDDSNPLNLLNLVVQP